MILLATEGRGGAAEIELDGQRLTVVDELSPADGPLQPGPLEGARLEVVVNPRLTRRLPPEAGAEPGFEADHGWRYRARGEIVATAPLRADLGLLQLDLDVDDTREPWAPGDRIAVAIDRVVLAPG